MRERKAYICDICGTEYNDPESAKACEAHHKQPWKVKTVSAYPYRMDKTGFPDTVEVTFKGGETAKYKIMG